MLPLKRKRVEKDDSMAVHNEAGFSSENDWEDHDVELEKDHEDSEMEFIQDAIVKRNIKDGTELLKKTSKVKGKGKAKGEVGGGSFQSMGLHPSLLRALTLRGFRTPTPIQRAAIPLLLTAPPRDLVGMARTGSGKTLAYMIPLLQRLGGRHSPIVGARALILVPSRELAVQVLKVGRDLARGWKDGGEHAGEKDTPDTNATSSSSSALRWALVVGGEGLDEQFETMATNPDIIIATPGRLLHLQVEMSLSLSAIQYLVFDEADRLFELGFATHLTNILSSLPTARQTLLFSATLPKSLVEFAKAGLREPKLVRLDSEMKISSDLRMSFWWVKEGEKTAGLLSLLRDVIGVPLEADLSQANAKSDAQSKGSKSKKGDGTGAAVLAPHQSLIFVSTQHHVHYLSTLLSQVGYAVSAIHGNLTQSARTFALSTFSQNQTSIMVTTDVAARGIDIPILENVVNYDFPVGNRVFVHRVGRTARMGRRGWAWNFVTREELPYLLDLQLFLGRPLINPISSIGLSESSFVDSLILGPFPRDVLDQELEYIRNLEDKNYELVSLKGVMERGSKMYNRTKGKASPVSYGRAKEFNKERSRDGGEVVNPAWILRTDGTTRMTRKDTPKESKSNGTTKGKSREDLLKTLASFKPSETVFEIGSRGKTTGALLMKERRRVLSKAASRTAISLVEKNEESTEDGEGDRVDIEMANEDDIMNTFGSTHASKAKGQGKSTSFKDEEFYISHYQKDAETEKGYSLRDGASFAEQASHATFDLTTDTGGPSLAARRQSQLKWDRKKKKFIKGDGAGADNVKMIRTEGGTKVPVSYKSGRYEEWVKGRGRGRDIRVGEMETGGNKNGGDAGRKWRHRKVDEAKPLDKLAKDYERKVRVLNKKKADGNMEHDEGGSTPNANRKGKGKGKPLPAAGRWKGKTASKVKNELKSVQQIRKQRTLLEKRREKNARASKKGKGRGKH